jgi:hypothetical protein
MESLGIVVHLLILYQKINNHDRFTEGYGKKRLCCIIGSSTTIKPDTTALVVLHG